MANLKFFVESLRLLILSLVLLLLLGIYSFNNSSDLATEVENQNGSITKSTLSSQALTGKIIFKSNCASCHNKNMKDKMTGPPLAGSISAWSDYPKEDLYNWIRNSQKMIEEKHPRALALWKTWQPITMTPFPNLEDEQIDAVISYIEEITIRKN